MGLLKGEAGGDTIMGINCMRQESIFDKIVTFLYSEITMSYWGIWKE